MAEVIVGGEKGRRGQRRMIITTIDTLTDMFKDYCRGEIPNNAQAVRLQFKPTEKGKLGIVMESDEWKTGGQMEVKFEIKRFFGVGGGQ
jgi:hypothetical protein